MDLKMKKLMLSILLIVAFPLGAGAETIDKESTFDRVMRTNTLRCAYYVFPPVTYRDPNTNALSGLSVDIMNEIGKRASIKIEWTEETNFSNWIIGLQAHRFDASCTPQWPDIPQARSVAFSIPMFYAGLYAAVRADNMRFPSDTASVLNDPSITFAYSEGDAPYTLIKNYFPKAALKALPADGNISAFAMDVITKKSDAFITDYNGVSEFNRNNPNKIRLLGTDHPLKFQASSLAVEAHDIELKNFLDNAILDLQNDGTMDILLRKWENNPGHDYLRVASPAAVAP